MTKASDLLTMVLEHIRDHGTDQELIRKVEKMFTISFYKTRPTEASSYAGK